MFFDPFLAILRRAKTGKTFNTKQSRTSKGATRSDQTMSPRASLQNQNPSTDYHPTGSVDKSTPQLQKPETAVSVQCSSTISAQELVLQIDRSRIQQVAYRAGLLCSEDSQLVVNFLSKALEEDGVLSSNIDRALPILGKIASSTGLFPTHRTLKSLHYEPSPAEEGGNVHYGEPGLRVKVLKQRRKEPAYSEALTTWAHLSHPNILPLYGVFFEGQENRICLVSPQMAPGNISTHSKKLPRALRMSLISDLTNGLCYLHCLNIAHGGLDPRTVLVSEDGRALIADFGLSSATQDSGSSTARYSAPEVLSEDNTRPSMAADMWSFGCVLYEVLSGNIPFYQYRAETRVAVAVVRGEKPIWPSQSGTSADEADTTMWHSMLSFWEIEPGDRSSSSNFREILSVLGIRGNCPKAEPARHPRYSELMNDSAIDYERAQAVLAQLLPSSISIPGRVQRLLSRLICKKLDDVVAAQEKLCLGGSDTQNFLDFLELTIERDILPLDEHTRVQDLRSRIKKQTTASARKYAAPVLIENDGPEAKDSPIFENFRMALDPGIDMHCVEILLHQMQSVLLQRSLSVIVLNYSKEVAEAATRLNHGDVQVIVDFMDVSLRNNITVPEERNRTLAVLSEISYSTRIFPQRLLVEAVNYHSSPMTDGELGTLHRGLSDPNLCVKVVARIDSADVSCIRTLILWANSLHPNILPFHGMFLDESLRICLLSPFMEYENLRDYAVRLPQKSRWLLILDTIKGLGYLHAHSIVHGDLNPRNILVSDEGRALVTGFGLSYASKTTAQGPITSTVPFTLQFAPPERLRDRFVRSTKEGDIWSFGCLVYEVLSRKLPYSEYHDAQVSAALYQGQLPRRPLSMVFDQAEDDWDEIDDLTWDLIKRCCIARPEDRPLCSQIQELILTMATSDTRPEAKVLPGSDKYKLQTSPETDQETIDKVLSRIQVEVFQNSISKLSRNHIKELSDLIGGFDPSDVRTLVEFLDLILANHVASFEERNRILALLSRIAAFARIFPRRYELEGIRYQSIPFNEGASAKMHRGLSNPGICIKVMTRADYGEYIKELILWAHLSHTNLLPFYGVFVNRSQQLCFASPFMKNGNLGEYAFRLSQHSRVPLLSDIIDGLEYLHSLDVVHSDLKPANVLISDDGRALIADHGASHVTTKTAQQNPKTSSPVNYTLRFMAPEIVTVRHVRPTKLADIWSFGCLCYHVLSRKTPYYQYEHIQITAALMRKEPPKRPGLAADTYNEDETDDLWDDPDEEQDWDEVNDDLWDLIVRCCTPQSTDRPTISDIQQMIADMKIEDNRPRAKGVPPAILKQRFNPEIDLRRVEALLARIQAKLMREEAIT